MGTPKPLTVELAESATSPGFADYPEADAFEHTSEEKALRRDLVKFIHRSYEQGLFTSTQGTYSARLSDGGFVITPYGKDRMYLDVDDLVLVRDGRTERGKLASRATHLHEEIYRQHSDINSILVAQPPHLLHDGRQSLEPHTGINRGFWQRVQSAVLVTVVLHENEIPYFNIPVTVFFRCSRWPTRYLCAVIIEDFSTRPAWAGITHGPEIVLCADAGKALRVYTDFIQPDVGSFIILFKNRNP